MNRQRLIRFVGLGAALGATLALAGTAGARTDHSPAPMMAPAKAPLSEEAYRAQQAPGGRQEDADTITARFRDHFSNDGKARIAVLWNQALSSRVSDWQSRQRATLGVRGEFETSGPDGDSKGNAQGQAIAQNEYRGADDAANGTAAHELQSGLITTFRGAGASVVDHALAARLTDNALEDGSFSRLSPDQARLRMRALAAHADFVMELTAGPAFEDRPVYQVRVLSTRDASVLAVFTSTGRRDHEEEPPYQWVATDRGYQKREQPVSLAQVGRELALQTMARMAP